MQKQNSFIQLYKMSSDKFISKNLGAKVFREKLNELMNPRVPLTTKSIKDVKLSQLHASFETNDSSFHKKGSKLNLNSKSKLKKSNEKSNIKNAIKNLHKSMLTFKF